MRTAAFSGNHPESLLPGRLMPYMLGVSTRQIRYPVIELILMKIDNFPFNACHKTTTNRPVPKWVQ